MLAGCFGDDDSDQEELIELIVHYDATNGTIQQSFLGGSQISFTSVTFSFDFARTTSDYGLKTFTLDPGDGRAIISIDASESANIDVEYQIHGMYTVILAATDINDNTANMTVVVRVEHSIEWSEANSADPDTMEIEGFNHPRGRLRLSSSCPRKPERDHGRGRLPDRGVRLGGLGEG